MSNVMWGESDPIHGLDYKGIADSLETDYELIHSTENLQVYRHRAGATEKSRMSNRHLSKISFCAV